MFKTMKKNAFFGKVIGAVIASAAITLACGFTAMAAPTAEKEPNNKANSATAFDVSEGATGTISAERDEDWYKFTLTQASTVSVYVEFTENVSDGYYVTGELYDDTQSVNYFLKYFHGGIAEETENYNLAAGTYYIRMSHGYGGDNHQYTVNVISNPVDSATEIEKNDTSATANAISLDTKEFGQLSHGNDVDWYKFDVAKPGVITVTFEHQYYGYSGTYWTMNLYADANGQTVYYSKDFLADNRDAITSGDFYVAAGTYYISVKKASFLSPLRYGITVNYKDSDTVNGEKENNDSTSAANAITTNLTYVGNLSTEKDVDWYKFTLDAPETAVKLEFKTDYGFTGLHWNVSLFTDLQSQLFTKSSSCNGIVSDSMNLVAGTYYVKVCADDIYTNFPYRLTINSEATSYYIPGKNCCFVNINGKDYWYENGYRQGTYYDANGVMGDGTIRGREIYDPASNGWYWLDACYDGAKAVGKEVWMPYIYQNEAGWSLEEMTKIANESDPGMELCVLNAMLSHSGKWVRYDQNGKMLKGWVTISGALADLYPDQKGNIYYYDHRTGLMARGFVTIEGKQYFFNEISGARMGGIINIGGVDHYFDEGSGIMQW